MYTFSCTATLRGLKLSTHHSTGLRPRLTKCRPLRGLKNIRKESSKITDPLRGVCKKNLFFFVKVLTWEINYCIIKRYKVVAL